MFPSVRVHHLPGSLSDHCPLWISSDDENIRFYKRNRPFRFEAVWLKDERCEGVVKTAWEHNVPGSPMERLIGRVEVCRANLQTWNRVSFGNIRNQLRNKKKQLAKAEALSMAGANHERVKLLKEEVYELMVKEDTLW